MSEIAETVRDFEQEVKDLSNVQVLSMLVEFDGNLVSEYVQEDVGVDTVEGVIRAEVLARMRVPTILDLPG